MASEEERAAILQEYKAASAAGFEDDEEDDEADFDPGDDSDSHSDEEEADFVLMDGILNRNDEGRLLYSGTWSFSSSRDKHHKFKLRSQEVFCSREQLTSCGGENDGGSMKAPPLMFDFAHPTQSKLDDKSNGSTVPSRRTILFDGFFVSDKNNEASNGEQHKKHGDKIKERDVEIFISHNAADDSYSVTGRGHNTYGPFVMEGKYIVSKNDESQAVMELQKTYGSGGSAKDTNVARGAKRRHCESDDDEFDDEDYEEKAGFAELVELTEDANLSVEELRRKYYGGGGDGSAEKESADDDGGGGKLPAKKARLEESDDSDCGF